MKTNNYFSVDFNNCPDLKIFQESSGETRNSFKINHGIEVIKSCEVKFFITNVSITKEIQTITRCDTEEMGVCDKIFYHSKAKIPNPMANWRMKKTFSLNLPHGSVINYVGEKTFCNKPIGNKYIGTVITEREIIVGSDLSSMGGNNELWEIPIHGNMVVQEEDVKIGYFKAKRYVIERKSVTHGGVFIGTEKSIDKINNITTNSKIYIAFDEDPNSTSLADIISRLL